MNLQQEPNIQEIQLYQAIKEMRQKTDKGEFFSFTYASCNKDARTSEGLKVVRCAKCRPAAKNEDVKNSDFKLFYFDEDSQKPRNCWQHLIMFYNGQKIIL
jgi:hypothetical protein